MKKHTAYFAELISTLEAEDQSAVARFLDEHSDNPALALLSDAARNYAQAEAQVVRQECAKEAARIQFERFLALEQTMSESKKAVLDGLRQRSEADAKAAQELKTQWNADNEGIKDSFRRFLVIVGATTLLIFAAIYGLARNKGTRHRVIPIVQVSPEE